MDFYSTQYLLYGRAMAQVVSRRPLTAEARVRPRVNADGICGGHSDTGTGFCRVCRFSSVSIISPTLSKLILSGGEEQYVR
jgi:hypothetical protein